ncbi:MAG: xanthine dehydrogenase family protein subunit M [Synergistaceae bacterium]|nr:xanthine dehydrogenase family protein subunit M [Synergistaceae bacterium]
MKQLGLKEYLIPESLEEAVGILDEYPGNIEIIAGGTDVFVDEHPELDAMLDITKLGLDHIVLEEGTLHLGSCATYHDIIKSSSVKENFRALWDASNVLADMTVRNIATVGGNICSAVPSGDAIPPMLACGAEFVLTSKNGERTVGAKDFFIGPRRTVLKKNELIKEFRVTLPKERFSSSFEKVARNSVDLANANVAVFISCAADKSISDIRIALGAVAPTVVRAKAAEKLVLGRRPDEWLLNELCAAIPETISPITNIRSTKEYRTEVTGVLVKRAVLRAYESAAA